MFHRPEYLFGKYLLKTVVRKIVPKAPMISRTISSSFWHFLLLSLKSFLCFATIAGKRNNKSIRKFFNNKPGISRCIVKSKAIYHLICAKLFKFTSHPAQCRWQKGSHPRVRHKKKQKPCPSTIQLPMWKSLLFGICHPLQDYQACAVGRFSTHPARRKQRISF